FGMTKQKIKPEERAVRAGLRMLESVDAMNRDWVERIQIGVGVNTGTVVAGYMGTKYRVELTVLGNTVNVAFALQTNARPNRLLIGPATLAVVLGLFDTKRVGAIDVKGRLLDIQAHEVLKALKH
ncbi:MAG TPA: adenylate/guanylate cyclase domain-containing protein, partial [bacterium]|nr:adenylate/guanylate cyclase domain-containing protein [bacterium]